MRYEDIARDIEEVERELSSERSGGQDGEGPHPTGPRGISWPIKLLLALFMALILIMMVVPYWGVKMDPSPDMDAVDVRIPSMDPPGSLSSLDEARAIEIPSSVRQVAVQVTSQACEGNRICYAKALYLYVRDEIGYISDPPYEYIQHPEETLLGAGDCEDKTILLYSLMKSVGIRPRIVLIPGHAYLQVYLPEALRKYKTRDGWVNLDTTCRSCGFGELPPGSADAPKRYVY